MSVELLQSNQDVNDARATIFRALGDPNRLRIFQTLAEAGKPLNVTTICEQTDLEANLVSHHLQCLKNCQLVDAERDGRQKFYEVSRTEAVETVDSQMSVFDRTSRAFSVVTSDAVRRQ